MKERQVLQWLPFVGEKGDSSLGGSQWVVSPQAEHFSKRPLFASETQQSARLPGGADRSQLRGHQGAEKEPGTA